MRHRSHILIVNDADQPIGNATMTEAQERGLNHRTVNIMIEDTDGRVLLQKRAAHVSTYPNCWDVSAGGHVDDGENYDRAASRELQEELGLSQLTLDRVGTYRSHDRYRSRILNRFNGVYKATIPADTPLKLEDDEVACVKWYSIQDVKSLINSQPAMVSNGLVETFHRYY